MPHVVLKGKLSIEDIFNKFQGLMIRKDNYILKTNNFYINSDKNSILIESLAIQDRVKNNFISMISNRDDGVVVRIYPLIEVEKTNAVKKLLSEIAMQLIKIYPYIEIGETNLLDFLEIK